MILPPYGGIVYRCAARLGADELHDEEFSLTVQSGFRVALEQFPFFAFLSLPRYTFFPLLEVGGLVICRLIVCCCAFIFAFVPCFARG